MNVVQLLAHLPWPLVAGFLAGNLIPYLSALATRSRGWWTGVLTMALSFVDGLLSVLANSGTPVNWRAVLGTAFGTWVVAAVHHSKVLAGTSLEATLHSIPSSRTPAPKPAADSGQVAAVLVIIIVLLVLFAVLGGLFLHPLIWLVLLIALIVLLFAGRIR